MAKKKADYVMSPSELQGLVQEKNDTNSAESTFSKFEGIRQNPPDLFGPAAMGIAVAIVTFAGLSLIRKQAT